MATATTTPASAALQNIYHLRTVAEPSAKSCMVCFKPSTAVLITPDNKDFFYICRGHLVDRSFASPIVDAEQEAARKRKAELDREVAAVVAEHEAKKKKSTDGKTDAADKSSKSDKTEKGEKADVEADQKADVAATDATAASTSTPDESSLPRIYALHRSFFQMRVERIRGAERARRNRERLANPTTFPSVPSGIP